MNASDYEELCRRYWDIRERVCSDPEYALLSREVEELEPRYGEILGSLAPEDRQTLERYLLLRENRNLRMLEFAVCARSG